MTTEQEKAFQEWWRRSPILTLRLDAVKAGFSAGWEAALATAMPMTADELIHIARQNERDTVERKLLAMAGAAFIADNDEHAHWFRSLVNVLFKKPGDESV